MIISVEILLSPTHIFALEDYDALFTEEECAAISKATGQNLIYYPPGCNLYSNDIEIDNIEDVTIFRPGLDAERLTLFRFSDPAKSKTHLDEVAALLQTREGAVTYISDTYKVLPTSKEPVMIGDGGVIVSTKISSHVN